MLETENEILSVRSATHPRGDSSLKVKKLLVVLKCAAKGHMQPSRSKPQKPHYDTKRQGPIAQMRA